MALILALRRVQGELREARRRNRELEAALAAALRARERADRAHRTKTAFLRTVGHELRAPLTALREAVPHIGAGTPPARIVAASADWIAELCAALVQYAQSAEDQRDPS